MTPLQDRINRQEETDVDLLALAGIVGHKRKWPYNTAMNYVLYRIFLCRKDCKGFSLWLETTSRPDCPTCKGKGRIRVRPKKK